MTQSMSKFMGALKALNFIMDSKKLHIKVLFETCASKTENTEIKNRKEHTKIYFFAFIQDI